ncbi:MAG: insulinase family protein [Deltaproteobacteria bacterium]|nr:MAG: insulinase family protein [Deltaproteobacteria bacterium]
MKIGHGFELLTEKDIPELQTRAALFRHVKSGAELLSLMNNDENKVFGITFRTPPTDSTGVAHILEHSVLCGSRKYPLKEPFVELMKGSLQTFLNAFTYPDKTCYPVASQNLQDFYNLIDVYLDAVLYPRLTPFVLQQEGWHLDLEQMKDRLTYKGVVFNEMKGAYSSPDRVLGEYSQQSLFPGHSYGLDSGGNPKHIPQLTFDQFKSFHQRYYHPSNSRIFVYGNDDPEQRLRLLDDYLKDFDWQEVDSTIPLQPKFEKPERVVRPFAAGDDVSSGRQGMFTMNWLLAETADAETNFALRILDYILLGMPASPLRKALIDSGLGDDLAGVGLEDELRQMYFSTGLKGIDVADAERVESLIVQTLTKLAREGIDPLTVEAALNTVEFRLRENNAQHYPQGLLFMLRALTTWLHDADPLALLAFEAPLSGVKSQLAANPGFFETLIDRFFLENQHRSSLILEPDPNLTDNQEREERERLATIQTAMEQDDLREVIEQTLELRRLQETPDTPEALATIPTLKLSDLDKENKTIPLTVTENRGTRRLFHDLETSGIVYLDMAFNLLSLEQDYLPYVPLFGRALLELGTEEEDFVALTQRIGRHTGGIYSQSFASAVSGKDEGAFWLFLRGKAIRSRSSDLVTILGDVLSTVQLDNQERFRQMVMEEKARQEQRLVPEGHLMVNLRLRAHFHMADWVAEQMKGVSYLAFLRDLARRVDEDWPAVLSRLEQMHRLLVNRENMLINVTCRDHDLATLEPHLDEFLDALPSGPVHTFDWSAQELPRFEGMTIPAQVNYVGKGANLYDLGYRLHGSSHVISRFLRTAWLWDQVRVRGGAYGAFCLFNNLSGTLTFVSYRDPNLLDTLETFDRTAKFLRSTELRQEELTKSIIGTIGDIDRYLLPDAKGYTSMVRYLTNDSEEKRQRLREEVLNAEVKDFRVFADVLDGVKTSGLVKVLGSSSAIEGATSERKGWLEVMKLL